MRKSQRRLRLLVPALVVTAIAAVTWGTVSADAVPARHATSKQTTLVVWGLQQSDARTKVQNAIVQQFEKQYNVKVEWQGKSFNDVFTSVKLGLSGPGAPDIAQLPQGWPMVQLVKANLLRPLNSYAKKYGWYTHFSQADIRISSASANGATFGRGNLYGVSAEDDILGVFYNKAKFASLGLKIPKTFAQFEQALAKAKAGGETPIQLGDSDQWPLLHASYLIIPQFVSKLAINNFVYSKGAQLPTASFAEAANRIAQWNKKGYFPPGMLGTSADDSFASFLKGDGVFYLGGSWYISNIEQAKAASKYGFFLMPPRKAGASPAVIATGENQYAISTRSQNPDLAAKLLNVLTGKHFAQLLVSQAHDIPAANFAHPQASTPMLKDILGGLSQLQKANGMLPWLDWASPTMYTTMAAGEQELVSGKIDGQQLASRIATDKMKFKQSK
jgi:raffinose/stachyose/melibiose transport system substrate-binding protein